MTNDELLSATCPLGAKRRRLTDGGGLYLEISPAGSKRWFWKFYLDGKESRLALGSHPSISLERARELRDRYRAAHRAGINPLQKRRLDDYYEHATGMEDDFS